MIIELNSQDIAYLSPDSPEAVVEAERMLGRPALLRAAQVYWRSDDGKSAYVYKDRGGMKGWIRRDA